MKTIKTLIIVLLFFSLTGCGQNIFSSFVDNTDKDLTNKIENASTVDDFNALISDADAIINDPNATNEEKIEANYIKAEAILGKYETTPLDVMTKIATSSDGQQNPINIISTSAPKDALLDASSALAAAESLGGTLNSDQNLMKGIINTMVVINTLNSTFNINENGDVENNITDYSQALDDIIYPDPSNTSKTILTYSTSALEGFQNSGALTTQQVDEAENIKTKVNDIDTLFQNKNSKTSSQIETELKNIFKGF